VFRLPPRPGRLIPRHLKLKDDQLNRTPFRDDCTIGGLLVTIWLLLVCSLLFVPTVLAQDAMTRNQEWCARKAEANMSATKENSPEIAETILTYMYEYSPAHHTCVAIMEYKTKKNGEPYAQILARNLVTSQPMKGFAEIYLIPMKNTEERIKAINYLFAEYGK
jgi:hypothetical protein